jgi:hypothetical protein
MLITLPTLIVYITVFIWIQILIKSFTKNNRFVEAFSSTLILMGILSFITLLVLGFIPSERTDSEIMTEVILLAFVPSVVGVLLQIKENK